MTSRGLRTSVACVVAATVLTACGSAGLSTAARGPVAATAVAPLAATPPTPPMPARPVDRLPSSPPVTLTIPEIGVRTGPLLELGVDAGGVLEVPPHAGEAGWFRLSPTPGAVGPAVIAAHVDYAGVPGVFARLHELKPGAEVDIGRADGTEAVFEVYAVERFPKTGFPTERVYGDTEAGELRLITCGGVFDRGTGQYLDNVVAFARLTGVRTPGAR